MTTDLRVAVAGLGFMGATHIRAWEQVEGARLTAVVSGSPRKLAGDLSETAGNLSTGEKTQFDFANLKRYSCLEEALADPDIDVVDLCMPTHLHAQSCREALRAGKHVLVEKPLARTSAEAYQLAEEAELCGRVLMTGHVLRFFPEWHNLAQFLQANSPGLAWFRRNCGVPSWSTWLMNDDSSGGSLLDLMIHDADFVLHCFGKPERLSAVGFVSSDRKTDLITAQCTFPNGSVAMISGGWHPDSDYPFSMEFEATAAEKTVNWSSKTAENTDFNPWTAQLQHFADAARKNTVPTLAPAREAADAVRFVELLSESRRKNGEWLPWTN